MQNKPESIRFQDILDEVELAFEAGIVTPEMIAAKLKLPVWLVKLVVWRLRKK